MKPSDTITLNAPSEFPLQILHEVAIMTILITRGESLRARPLPPARYARCLPTAPPVFPQRQNKNKQKNAVFLFQKQTRFCFLVPCPPAPGPPLSMLGWQASRVAVLGPRGG